MDDEFFFWSSLTFLPLILMFRCLFLGSSIASVRTGDMEVQTAEIARARERDSWGKRQK